LKQKADTLPRLAKHSPYYSQGQVMDAQEAESLAAAMEAVEAAEGVKTIL